MKASDYAITNYDDIRVGDRVAIAQYSSDLGVYENLQEASVTAKGDGHFKVLIIEQSKSHNLPRVTIPLYWGVFY